MYKTLRYLSFVFGMLIGILLVYTIDQVVNFEFNKIILISSYTLSAIIFGIIFYLLFPKVVKKLKKDFEKIIQKNTKDTNFRNFYNCLRTYNRTYNSIFNIFTIFKYKISGYRWTFKYYNHNIYLCNICIFIYKNSN